MHTQQLNRGGRKKNVLSNSFFLLRFIPILYYNFLFVLAASNQIGKEGLAIIVATTEVVVAVVQAMAAMAKVMGCKG